MSITEVTAVIGVVSGVSALVLSVVNSWHQWATSRPHIAVRPHGPPRGRVIMEIHNVGYVPVVGSNIGFLPVRPGEHGFSPNLAETQVLFGTAWMGEELKPQHAVVLRFSLEGAPQELGRAYADTIVGDVFKASRRDTRRFAKEQKAASGGRLRRMLETCKRGWGRLSRGHRI